MSHHGPWHADIAYEWQFAGIRTAENTVGNDYTEAAQQASKTLADAYPAYLEGLGVKTEDGSPLTADTMKLAILAAVRRETEGAIAKGVEIPAIGEDFVLSNRDQTMTVVNDWLTVENGAIVNIDYEKYLGFVTRAATLKIVPALRCHGQ